MARAIFIFFFLLICNSIFAQWMQQPSNSSINFQSLIFLNANTGFAVGSQNTILKTTNGGANWISKYSDSFGTLYCCNFSNSNSGIAAGLYGSIFTTTNSGEIWTHSNLISNAAIYFIKFTSFNIGWFVNTGGQVYKTTDSGNSWEPKLNMESNLYTAVFLNDFTGWVPNFTGFPDEPASIYKTTNGGTNWKFFELPIYKSIWSSSFSDSINGWLGADSGTILKTSNGGENWSIFTLPISSKVKSIFFVNDSIGYAASDNGLLFKTFNGGYQWNQQVTGTTGNLFSIFFLDAQTGWICGSNGTILKTTNGGGIVLGENHYVNEVITQYNLLQNYPNPFNPNTNIEFSLPQNIFVKLKVFDLLGREVANLVNEKLSAGSYKYDFNASLLPSGIYFYKLETENFSETKKMVLVK